MKKKCVLKKLMLFVVVLFITQFSIAQEFPAPTNFEIDSRYIGLDGVGSNCDGLQIFGPEHVTHFSWDEPDLSSTTATLEYYTIYSGGVPVATTQNTTHCVDFGFAETELYVKATYSNPDGESEASNIVEAGGLPIGIKNVLDLPVELVYSKELGILSVKNNTSPIKDILLYDMQGRKVVDNQGLVDYISTDQLIPAIYLVSITFQDDIIRNIKVALH